jgi:hypothetical protein
MDVTKRLSTIRFLRRMLRKSGDSNESGDKAALAGPAPLHDPLGGGLPADPAKLSRSRQVLAVYRGNIELIQALAERYRFKCLFYWQPSVFQKARLTPYENAERVKMESVSRFDYVTYAVMRESRLADTAGGAFSDLSLIFADNPDPLYVDWCHLGESGNALIAQRMTGDILKKLAP